MKQILRTALPLLLLTAMFSCNIMEVSYPDYAKSTIYFPSQTPVRTLILGVGDPPDSTRDNDLLVSIPVSLGGVNQNSKDRKVSYAIDESLAQGLYTSNGDTLVVMPKSYYTIAPSGTLVIPKGSLQGFIKVQLNESFLNDPRSLTNHYVIPLKLTNAQPDSILQGEANAANPDPRVSTDWSIPPKDYMIICIKYINKYQGNYLYFGRASVKDQAGVEVDRSVYSASNISDNPILTLNNTSENKVVLNTVIPLSINDAGPLSLDLVFDNNGSATVKGSDGAPAVINGTGKFIEDGTELNGRKRALIALDYTYTYNFSVEPTTTIINDADPSVHYTGTWNHNAEAGNYNGDRSYCNTPGDYLELDFIGYEVNIFTKTSSAYGYYDVYIDDELVATHVDCSTSSAFQVKTYSNSGLTNARHHLKCVVQSAGKWCIFDYFQFKAAGIIPNGTYTWNVKDTLVVHDRTTDLTPFVPVIK